MLPLIITKVQVNLYKIDITGFREIEILTPSDGSDPAWSPLLPN